VRLNLKEKHILSETSNPLVSVIILNYNGKDVLGACLDSVFASFYSPFEVIVVDNGSTDGSADLFKEKYPFKLLRNQSNLGYCGGNNLGIGVARGEFLVLLNFDTVVKRNWLNELVSQAIKLKADFCQPKILMFDNPKVINSTGLEIHFAGFGLLRSGGKIDSYLDGEPQEVTGVHGACMFASRRAIEEVGLLDSNFFAFCEDTDWSWKALLLGLKLVYVPSATVYHRWGEAWGHQSIEKLYYAERNRMIMVLTNYSYRSLILLLPVFVLTEFVTLAYCFLNKTLKAKILAYSYLLQMRQYIVRRRRRIQSARRVSDTLIVERFTYEFEHPFLAKFITPVNAIYKWFFGLIAPFI
jgi:GT2 family glycosyltransferase